MWGYGNLTKMTEKTKTKKNPNSTYWWGHGETGSFIHCYKEHKLAEVLSKTLLIPKISNLDFSGGSVVKRNHRRCGFDTWVGKTPGEWHGNPLNYSCLENSMDRGAWQTIVHRVAKSQTWLKQLSMQDQQFTPKNIPNINRICNQKSCTKMFIAVLFIIPL